MISKKDFIDGKIYISKEELGAITSSNLLVGERPTHKAYKARKSNNIRHYSTAMNKNQMRHCSSPSKHQNRSPKQNRQRRQPALQAENPKQNRTAMKYYNPAIIPNTLP